jgi:alpha-mannosidase
MFETHGFIEMQSFQTSRRCGPLPKDDSPWAPCPVGTVWGGDGISAWFRGTLRVPGHLANQSLFIRAAGTGTEAMLWVNGQARGLFNPPSRDGNLGAHREQLLCRKAVADTAFHILIEGYAGHRVEGTQPYDVPDVRPEFQDYPAVRFSGVEILALRPDVRAFVFDLQTVLSLFDGLAASDFTRASMAAVLEEVFTVIVQDPHHTPESRWREALVVAEQLLGQILNQKSTAVYPQVGIIGHSHMDTAWLWPMEETIRKCARTYSNALHLMEQYPEYLFVQSSMVHLEFMRANYPEIFHAIRQRIQDGRWEPIGLAWVEPDANVIGGEALVRQFVRGDRFCREYLGGYRSDVFWLPDTFGYSAALPQILRSCGIRYFLTTKLSWNESNAFPYDTFEWRGIDGSEVLCHCPAIHCHPDPKTLLEHVYGGDAIGGVMRTGILHREVTQQKMIAFGFGDGGGGPNADMLEAARRVLDMQGCPRSRYTLVHDFMTRLSREIHKPPIYCGELYLEGHRGTLTQMHQIKRHNRKLESALRELELVAVLMAAPRDKFWNQLQTLWDTLLVNQFHDILPGTSIPAVHNQSLVQTGAAIQQAVELIHNLAGPRVQADVISVFNGLSWPRTGEMDLDYPLQAFFPLNPACTAQHVTHPDGTPRLVLSGITAAPLAVTKVALGKTRPSTTASPFRGDKTHVNTPLLAACFEANGEIGSLIYKPTGRELRGAGLPLNTLLFGEDVPAAWDNWDIDADLELKLKPCCRLKCSEVIADGPLQFRLRQHYHVGQSSELVQDVVFHRDTPRVDFESVLDWQEKHAFLKAGFHLNVHAPAIRYEIQFGHLQRTNHRNWPQDRARFEVCHHKWADISEARFGVAVLNDSKYGISADGSDLRLSLHKGGCHPDPRGDAGRHILNYALLAHAGPFTAEAVVRPAYEFNHRLACWGGTTGLPEYSFVEIDSSQIVLEAMKPAEDGRGLVLRLYECEGGVCQARLKFQQPPARAAIANMLEDVLQDMSITEGGITLDFGPFEIKTVRLF